MRAGKILKEGGSVRGNAQLQRLLKSPSFGTFLGEARKVHYPQIRKTEPSNKMTPILLLIFSKPTLGSGFNSLACGQALFDIQNPLVFAAPKGDFQTPFRQQEGTVNENVDG